MLCRGELEQNNLLEEDVHEINGRLDEIESGKTKTLSEDDHLGFINNFGKDA